jgi:endonuclease III
LLDTNDRQKRQTQYQRAKTDLDTTFQLIVNAVQEQQTLKNPVQRAIELLQQEYSIKLTSDELDRAIDVLTNKTKAIVFITLDKDNRDRWLQRNANVALVDREAI